MEIISGGVGGRAQMRSMKHQTSCLQGMILMFIMFTTHFPFAASKRNMSIMWFDTASPWNKTYYKDERRCLDFHNQNASSNFFYWPEDEPHFDHCCADNSNIPNRTYGVYGPIVGYATYYDLGIINQCLPYWRCFSLYHLKLYAIVTFHISCERRDLEGLYTRRFWIGTVLKYGLGLSALPMIVILEILVVLFILYFYCTVSLSSSLRSYFRRKVMQYLHSVRKGSIYMVWVHLCLLAIIGNGLIEAIGRQNPYQSQSKAYYNYARLYVVLFVLVWVSSLLQQLSYCVALIKDLRASDPSKSPRTPRLPLFHEFEKEIELSDDWNWQPIAAQAAILFCLWSFLTYIDDNSVMGGGLFGIVVSVGAPWSGIYAVKISIHAIRFLFLIHPKGL